MREQQNLGIARHLRSSLTEPERRLWARLRRRQLNGLYFRRQATVGPYVADFACATCRLTIEIDGDTHAFTAEADARRSKHLERLGWRVPRFTNREAIENIEGVLEAISEAATSPLPNPAPQAGEGAEAAPAQRGREGPARSGGGRGQLHRK